MGATESEDDGKNHIGPSLLLLCSPMDGVESDIFMVLLKFVIRNTVCALLHENPQG